MKERALLLYDGRCPFCSRWARRAERWDRFHLLETRDLFDPEALRGTGAVISAEELASALHLILPDGRILKGFDALRRLLWIHPLFWIFIPAAYIPGVRSLGSLLYGRFARQCRFGL